MISVLSDMMSYTFIVRAMIVGGLVALCSALLGVSLVLKRYSMIGDGLSHVAFAALTIAVAMNVAPLYISTPIVTVAAIILLRLSENSKIKGDSAIALISTVSIAIGVVVTALTKGMNTDVYSYMFGSILAMSESDVYMSIALSVVVIILFVFLMYVIKQSQKNDNKVTIYAIYVYIALSIVEITFRQGMYIYFLLTLLCSWSIERRNNV